MRSYQQLTVLCTFLLTMLAKTASGVTVPRLSPLPAGIKECKLSLNGEWDFHPSFNENIPKAETIGWSRIQVPGEWVMQGFEVKKGEAAGYARTFVVPDSWQGQRIKLRCNAVYSDCTVFINGKKAGSHLGGFTAFELDVTSLVSPGQENTITLSVRSESIADDTSNASFYAVHPLGGILRDIYLFSLPETNFSMFHVSTSFDSAYTDAVLHAELAVTNESAVTSRQLHVEFTLTDAAQKQVPLSVSSFPVPALGSGDTEKMNLSLPVPNPIKWDSEHPYLYTLTCHLKDGEKTLSSTVRRVGFRQIEVRGNQVFVNNHPIKLRGVCRHEVMPLRGRSLTGDIWRKDVELFCHGNVNYIRTSHYPPDEALLEACDELGMFVEVEAPFCWAHQHEVPEALHDDVLVNQHVEMVNLCRSHPSVLMWSIGNESTKFEEYFRKAAEVVHELDPTRPRNFSQWGPDADGGMLEITNHHYPGPNGPEQYRHYKRPVVFDEFCHLNAYNRLELAADPGLRNMWGPLLDTMWNDMYHSQGVLGGAIWVGIDDTFFLPGGKAVGYGTWGTIDGWRREKPEYWGMKKAYSPVKITLKENVSADGAVVLNIENRHLFTNLSECRIKWETDNQQGIICADVAPRSTKEITLSLPEHTHSGQVLNLVVIGRRGFEVDRYCFQIRPQEEHLRPAKTKAKLTCEETEDKINVRIGEWLFDISKYNGLLSATCSGEEVLQRASELMVLPLNGEGEGIQMVGKDQTFTPFTPVCENWVARSIRKTGGKEVVEIVVAGDYKGTATGTFTYRFHRDGKITVGYDFSLLQDVSPRQVGIVFTLPKTFTRLSWKRKGYWGTYPSDHIGALEGNVEAFNHSLPLCGLAEPSQEPSVAWSFDQTANGSNFFRSTKENIYMAMLTNGHQQVKTISDGKQHFRAWVDEDKVRFLVADYVNAGSDTYLVSHAQKDYRPLRKGDTIKGMATLVLNNQPAN